MVLGRQPRLPIEEIDFTKIRDAGRALLSLLEVELDYNILLDNWVQLETAAMSLAIERFARSRWKRIETDRDFTELARHIVNVLSSARGFIDHTQGRFPCLPGSNQSDKQTIEDLFHAQYNAKLGYRVLEALRNYTQHHGLPLQGFSTPMRWVGAIEDGKLVVSMSPYLAFETLCSDPRFKRGVLEELESAGNKEIHVIPLVREYLEGLSAILARVRELYREKTAAWFGTFAEWADRYRDVAPGLDPELIGVAAIQINEHEEVVEEVHFGLEVKDRLAHLQRVNRAPLVNLHRLEVTS